VFVAQDDVAVRYARCFATKLECKRGRNFEAVCRCDLESAHVISKRNK